MQLNDVDTIAVSYSTRDVRENIITAIHTKTNTDT